MTDATTIELAVGRSVWPLSGGPNLRVAAAPALALEPLTDPAEALRKALDAPIDFPPVRRAVTPGDKVALVVNDSVPQLATLLPALIRYLVDAGVQAEDVSLVSPPGSPQSWVDDLPDELEDVTVVGHDASDRAKLSYLASTRGGRRVYLNRVVADADQVVVLTRRSRDAAGPTGGALDLYPALGEDAASREADKPDRKKPADPIDEAGEVAWMLGLPVFVQVIEGPGDAVLDVLAGPTDSLADGADRYDAVWRCEAPGRAPVVVAALAGDPARQTFGTLVAALEAAAKVCERDGRILLLTEAAPDDGGLFELGRAHPDAESALTELRADPTRANGEAARWLALVRRYRVSLASGWSEADTEAAFASKLVGVGPVQRLTDAGTDCVVLPDAAKARLLPRSGTHAAGR